MRICRIGKRIYVHGVPLNTTWFCPYCCATVDTPMCALRSIGNEARKRQAQLLGEDAECATCQVKKPALLLEQWLLEKPIFEGLRNRSALL